MFLVWMHAIAGTRTRSKQRVVVRAVPPQRESALGDPMRPCRASWAVPVETLEKHGPRNVVAARVAAADASLVGFLSFSHSARIAKLSLGLDW
jgi:hypothetical protein